MLLFVRQMYPNWCVSIEERMPLFEGGRTYSASNPLLVLRQVALRPTHIVPYQPVQ